MAASMAASRMGGAAEAGGVPQADEEQEMNDGNNDEKEDLYEVVVNHEEQYSMWPVGKEIPAGWKTAGKRGNRRECGDYIESVWTDMRPLSLRERMEADAGAPSTRNEA